MEMANVETEKVIRDLELKWKTLPADVIARDAINIIRMLFKSLAQDDTDDMDDVTDITSGT